MSRHRIARLLALSLALFSAPVIADPENPFLTPEHPTAEDTILVNAYCGPCDLLDYGYSPPPEVTVDGDQITVLLSGVHVTDPIWCTLGARIDSSAIGSFPPGSYMVTINWQYFNQAEDVQVTLGVLPLTIGNGAPAGEPVPLPTSDGFGLAMLALVLIVMAAKRFKRSCHKET